MKKLFLLLSALLLTNYTFSQTEKGNWNLGISSNVGSFYSVYVGASNNTGFGGLNFYSGFKVDGESEEGRIFSFNFNPGVGYFVIDGLLIRANIGISSNKFKIDDDVIFSTKSFIIGPELRYYFGNKNLRPYIGALASFGSAKEQQFIGESSLANYSGYVGVGYFIVQNASIDLSVGFNNITQKNKDDDSISFYNIGVNFGVNFFF